MDSGSSAGYLNGHGKPVLTRIIAVDKFVVVKAVDLNGDPIKGVNADSTYLYTDYALGFPLHPPAHMRMETVEDEI